MRTTLPITLTAFVLSLMAVNHASATLIGVAARDSGTNNLDAFGSPAEVTITVGTQPVDTGSKVTEYVDSSGAAFSDLSPMLSKLWIRETSLNQGDEVVKIYWRNRAMVERAAEEPGGGTPTTPPMPAGFDYLGSDVARMGSLPQGYIVVEMTYKVNASDEASGGPLGHLYLGTLVGEGSARKWMNAANRNIDQSTDHPWGPQNMSWTDFRNSASNSGKPLSQLAGSWGYKNGGVADGEGTVWAILDNRATTEYPNGFYTDRQLAAVPEPGTLTLLAAGGMVLAVVGLKRKRNRKAAV